MRPLASTRRNTRIVLSAGAAALLTTIAVLLLSPGASRADQPLHIMLGGGASFPSRSVVLSIPQRPSLTASQVHITENGGPVSAETVTPIRLATVGDFGMVLVLDSGPTMRGPAIEQAMSAAQAIAAQRTAGQELGLVLFSGSPTTKLPLTQNPVAIQQALAQAPPLSHGSTKKPVAAGAKARHIYDGVQLALQQLQAAGVAEGAVIVLSNGADQGSQGKLQAIANIATSAHVRIFTVGLRNRFFLPETLMALAKVGTGTYTEANDPSQLSTIFTHIEAGLASKYIVRYRSLQPFESHIQVTVSVDGVAGTASVSYSAPAPAAGTPGGHAKAASHPFWASTVAFAVAASACGLLIGLATAFVLLPLVRRASVRVRVREFVSGPDVLDDRSDQDVTPVRMPGPTERVLERSAWWPRFKEDVEIARIAMPAIQIVYLMCAATVAAAMLLFALVQSPVVIIVAAICGPLVMRAVVNYRLAAQRRMFHDQLASHVQEVAAAMRAGHSIVGAIRSMAQGASEPTSGEFRRALADEELGMPLDEALEPLARRMESEDMEQVALIVSLHRRAGGNMAEILDRLAEAVRQRAELRRELRALTAQARLSRWIVSALPVVLLLFITVTDRSYIKPLFNTTGGLIAMTIAAALVVAGSLVMRKIADIEP